MNQNNHLRRVISFSHSLEIEGNKRTSADKQAKKKKLQKQKQSALIYLICSAIFYVMKSRHMANRFWLQATIMVSSVRSIKCNNELLKLISEKEMKHKWIIVMLKKTKHQSENSIRFRFLI